MAFCQFANRRVVKELGDLVIRFLSSVFALFDRLEVLAHDDPRDNHDADADDTNDTITQGHAGWRAYMVTSMRPNGNRTMLQWSKAT